MYQTFPSGCSIITSPANQFCLSVNLQKLTSDLAGVQQQKKVLEMELEQWKQIKFPPQTTIPPTAPVNAEPCCQCRAIPAPANPALQATEAEVKQLQAKLKVSIMQLMNCPPFLFFLSLCMPYEVNPWMLELKLAVFFQFWIPENTVNNMEISGVNVSRSIYRYHASLWAIVRKCHF